MFHSANVPSKYTNEGKPLFLSFLGGKRGQIGKKSKKGCYGHQLGPMTHFVTTQKFDPVSYFRCTHLLTHFQCFLCMP